MLTILVLAGGSGTRLWPLSNDAYPKQFIKLLHDKFSMFQITINRVKKLSPRQIIIFCNKTHLNIVKHQISEITVDNDIVYQIIVEPASRNTAPPISITCKLSDPNETILVVPSDHIFNDEILINTINRGIEVVNDKIITFGIRPTYPETGYGYIKYRIRSDGLNDIVKFIEKPSLEKATKLITKKYLWNSGMFLFSNKKMTNDIQIHARDIWINTINCLAESNFIDNTLYLGDIFNLFQNISIDYAVMEKCKDGIVIEYDGKWSDIGSFKSLYGELSKDSNLNYLNGNIKTINTKNCLVRSDQKFTAIIGVDNLAIIDTANGLLVTNLEESQNVKNIANIKKEETTKCYRPWGWYLNIKGDDCSGFKVKEICVYPGKRLSLQSHKYRSEHWVIVKGIAEVRVGNREFSLKINDNIIIPIGELHRIGNNGTEDLYFIETQIGSYLGEDDIIRYEDDFGRASTLVHNN